MEDLAGKKVVVVGMAKSGTAAVQLLLARGAEVRAVDEKPHAPVLGVPVQPQVEESFGLPDLVVISPGVPADLAILESMRERGVPVIGELELAAPLLQGGNIGVTGTNGKTTTTCFDRAHTARGGHRLPGGRKHRNAAYCNGRNIASGSMECSGAFELPARNHAELSCADRSLPERYAESSGPSPHF